MRKARRMLFGTALGITAWAATVAPAAAQHMPCVERYREDVEYCYWNYDGMERQLCYVEASARYAACIRQTLMA